MVSRGEEDDGSFGLRLRRGLVKSISWIAALHTCLVLTALAGGHEALGQFCAAVGIGHSPYKHVGVTVVVLLWLFTVIVRIVCDHLDYWSQETPMDSYLRRDTATTLCFLMYIGTVLVRDLVEKSGVMPGLADQILLALFLLALASRIVFGPLVFSTHPYTALAREAREDEFYGALRAKSSKVLYGAVMLAGGIAYVLLDFHLAQETTILAAMLYGAVAVSLLIYNHLIWYADRVD